MNKTKLVPIIFFSVVSLLLLTSVAIFYNYDIPSILFDEACFIKRIDTPNQQLTDEEAASLRKYGRVKNVVKTYIQKENIGYLAYQQGGGEVGVEEKAFGFKRISCSKLKRLEPNSILVLKNDYKKRRYAVYEYLSPKYMTEDGSKLNTEN